jgi:hypothetical protein
MKYDTQRFVAEVRAKVDAQMRLLQSISDADLAQVAETANAGGFDIEISSKVLAALFSSAYSTRSNIPAAFWHDSHMGQVLRAVVSVDEPDDLVTQTQACKLMWGTPATQQTRVRLSSAIQQGRLKTYPRGGKNLVSMAEVRAVAWRSGE